MAIRGHVRLFIGPEVSREIRQRISDLKDKRHELFTAGDKNDPMESAELRKALDEEIRVLDKQLEGELAFWKDAKPERPKNTFEAIMLILAVLGLEAAYAYDFKGEIGLVSSLQRDCNIRVTDAFHLMQAHSAKLDYFLTWDRKQLINRAKRATWLVPKVMTPSEFLGPFGRR
jgi:hypothetical protein